MNPIFEFTMWGIIFYIPTYALFACVGLFFSMLIIYYRISSISGMTFAKYLRLIVSMALGMFLGSKCLFILTRIPEIVRNFSVGKTCYIIITSGFVFYGGLFGTLLAMYFFSRKQKINLKNISNVVVLAFPVFHMFGRIGCFFAGCCYGKASAWGIALKNDPFVLRFPVQLCESFLLLVIVGILLIIERKSNGGKWLLKYYLVMYAAIRFCLEFLRGDEIRGIWFGLSTSQWISLAIIFVLFIREFVIKKKNPPQTIL